MALNVNVNIHYNYDDEMFEIIDPITLETVWASKIPSMTHQDTGECVDLISFLSEVEKRQELAKEHASIVYWQEKFGGFLEKYKGAEGDIHGLLRKVNEDQILEMAKNIENNRKGNN